MSDRAGGAKAAGDTGGSAPRRGGRGMGMGPGGHGMTAPAEKSKDFKGSLRRLGGYLAPFKWTLVIIVALTVLSVAFNVLGPRILGEVTNVLFEGVVSEQLPEGTTQEQAVAGLRVQGQDQLAEMISSMTLTPGEGVDFQRIATLLALLTAVYVLSALFGWGQGYLMAEVAQRTVYRMREAVDQKLARLPLAYFDDHSRGDTLSRVTNDIDNIANTLAQSATQVLDGGAHHRRSALHDGIDQPAAFADIAPGDPAQHHRDDLHREAFAEAVHRSVGQDGNA